MSYRIEMPSFEPCTIACSMPSTSGFRRISPSTRGEKLCTPSFRSTQPAARIASSLPGVSFSGQQKLSHVKRSRRSTRSAQKRSIQVAEPLIRSSWKWKFVLA